MHSPKRILTRQDLRLQRIQELQILGLSRKEMVDTLKKEGFRASTATITRDLATPRHQEYVTELLRKQLRAIARLEALEDVNPQIALRWRDALLEKLLPKYVMQQTEAKLEVTEKKVDIQGLLILIGKEKPQLLDEIIQLTKVAEQHAESPTAP